ncbi:hypothetical protein P4L29_30810 [Bacillus cereus]|nr:hypothetical protein [Bacillus cereus]
MPYKIQKLDSFTISDLCKLEKKEKQASRQSVASYVKSFENLNNFNSRDYLRVNKFLKKKPYLTMLQQEELK